MAKSPQSSDEVLAGSDRLRRIGDTLRSGGSAPTITVREFLEWFGATRRGQWIVSGIRQSLEKAGIVTKPDFEEAFIESPITFDLPQKLYEKTLPKPPETASSVLVTESPSTPSGTSVDPTYRLSRLKAANTPPVSVSAEKPLIEAVTLLLKHDFSQLPVMANERTVKGMISWRSIGARWALDHAGEFVRDFMDDAYEVAADRSIFAALPIIVEQGYVLVRDATNRISGIVTTSDLSLQFQQLTEPFLLIGEIENHIRRLIDKRFSKTELADAKDPGDAHRVVTRAADMSFGEYVRLLEDPQRWSKLALPIDRTIFVKDLTRVRGIRNDVMHFDPDPLDDKDLHVLRQFVKFLQSLQTLGV